MHYRLSCEQVSALINFYAENALSEMLTKYMEEHLASCPQCNAKYLKIKNILNDCINVSDQNNKNEKNYTSKLYETFKTDLSAYIDNELEDNQNIKIKKIAISNPLARRDLEQMYTFKRMMHNSFEKTKNDFKEDYSKNIICKVKNECPAPLFSFYKITAMFLGIISLLVCTIIVFLYL